MNELKAKFLESMKLMYPKGIPNTYQWRDICKVYTMGWVDGLIVAHHPYDAEKYLEDIKPMADFNWWPDNTWKWW